MSKTLQLLGLILFSASLLALTPSAQTPPANSFHDPRYRLSLTIPSGWTLTTHDRDVSTFRLDARSAPRTARMRAVVTIASNPYPLSTFAGAFLYFSVTPSATDATCARQATNPSGTREVAHQAFTHGHDEQASHICTESRDDIYTAYRNHACYRFDLVTNTFCRQVSGAKDMTQSELDNIRQQMESILTTATF
jgi:hypothetical protein